jgi:cell shape-determining protein MreC
MHKLLYFIRNSYVAIIFIVLEIVAIRSYAYSTPYTQSQLLSTTNSVTRFVQSFFNDIGSYFSLRRENIMLTERLAELENRLDVLEDGSIATDVAPNIFQQYEFMAARVVSNSVNRAENYITLNKGIADGVRINMAVVTPDGYAVGTIVNCSDNFAIARSMLNTSLCVGARLAKDGSIGTIGWNGGDSQIVDFSEVTKYAQVEVGDVVTASGFSHYFPSDIDELNAAKPIYEYLPGFNCDISKCRTVEDLPKEALDYVRYIEKVVECPIKYVSVGAERDAYITMF